MIRKNLNKKLKEDFDFSKVKQHNIQDEYEFSSSVVRTQINSKYDLNDILKTEYSFDNIKNISEKGYYDIIGQCYYNRTKNLSTYGIILPEEFRTRYKNIIKIINNLEDDFNVLLASIICWWLNIESIDVLKNLILSDKKTYLTDYIGYWESDDHGIIIVDELDTFGNKDYNDTKRFIVCYTGKVNYSKDYKINEDFNFRHVKSKKIEDDYHINPKLLRETLSKSCNIADIIDPKILELFPQKINKADIRQYPNIGQCFGIIKNLVFGYNNEYVRDDMGGWFGWLEDVMFNLKFTEYEMTVEEAVNNIEYGDMFIDMLNLLTDGKYTQETNRLTSNSIAWWESPDRAYIVVGTLYYEYEDKSVKFIGCHDFSCGGFICFTGLNDLRNYNKLRLNEDFDFGKVTSKRVEDDYTLPRDVVRKANSLININDICISLWNYSIRPLLRPKSGRIHLSGGEVIQSVNTTFLVRPERLPFNKNITYDDEKALEAVGFSQKFYTNMIMYKNAVAGIDMLPDYMQDLIKSILRIPISKVVTIKYWLSPDEGIVIINYIKYNTTDEYHIIETSPIIAYTGTVEYKMADNNTDHVNGINIKEKFEIDGRAFINRLFKYLARTTNLYREYNILNHNGHLVMTLKSSNAGCYQRVYSNVENLFFDYRINSSGKKVLNSIIPFYTYTQSIDPMSIIVKKYDKETNNVIAGYISIDKNICLYYVTDYDVLVKLIGEENAKLTNKCGFNIKGLENPYYVYPFWYVTDKGMELFKKYQNGELSLRKI